MDISVVIPTYNEEGSIEELAERLMRVLNKMGKDYELIFVDDGSTDQTVEILKRMQGSDGHIVSCRLEGRLGKAAALSKGFELARGGVIITMDADLQDEPSEIPNFLNKIQEGYDLVSGWKRGRQDSLSRRLWSRLFNFVVGATCGLRLHDFNCGFKAYTKAAAKALDIYGELHRFIPVLAYMSGFKVTEIPVIHNPRKYGRSKYGRSRIFKGLFDFLTIIFITKFNRRPMHLFGLLGLFCILPGLLINLYFGILWVMGEPIRVRAVLIFGWVLLILGIQFFSIGLVGEMITYLTRQYQRSANRKG